MNSSKIGTACRTTVICHRDQQRLGASGKGNNFFIALKKYLDSQKGNCSVLGHRLQSHVQEIQGSWIEQGTRVLQSRSSLSPCSQIKCLTYCLLVSGVCSQLCFAHPKIQGDVTSCMSLEMPCGMQRSGKKSKPLAYRPQSWHRLRLWSSHNCLGTAVLFCWHVICLQQCADWAGLSVVVLSLPLLRPVEHFCISVVDHSLVSVPLHSRQEQKKTDLLWEHRYHHHRYHT